MRNHRAHAIVFRAAGQCEDCQPGGRRIAFDQIHQGVVDRTGALASAHCNERSQRRVEPEPRNRSVARRQRSQRSSRGSGCRIESRPQTSSTIGASSRFVKPGSALGSSKTRRALERRKNRRKRAARATGKQRNHRSQSRDPAAGLRAGARLWSVPLKLAAIVRSDVERERARQRAARDRLQVVAGLRYDRRLETVGGPDERDLRAALAQGVCNRDCRVEMSARPAARKNDGHASPRTLRAGEWRETLAMSATAMRFTTSELPPNEMNGSGTPVTGHDDETTPMLTKA